MVELARNDRKPSDLADEFVPTETTIAELESSRPIWMREKALMDFQPTNERMHDLKQKLDILAKATARS